MYQTITGGIQCQMVGGKLFYRDWPEQGPDGPWRRITHTAEDLAVHWAAHEAAKNHAVAFQYGCMLHCLTNTRPSSWYVEPKSERLTRQIEKLLAERELALVAEREDAEITKEIILDGPCNP